jgi:Ca-activated chloride channel family protein
MTTGTIGAAISVGAPLYLLALLALPLVALAYAVARKRRKRFAVRFPGTAVFAAIGRRPRLRRVLPAALLAAAATTLGVAMAKPERVVAVPVEKASVVLVTDESGSMQATDVDPSRLAAARSAATSFLDRVPDKLLVGFVGFSSQVNATVEPTLEREPVKAALENLQADGGTATGDALNTALDRLEARRGKDGKRAPAAVILLSDGKTTEGSDPLAAAERAKQLGIPVSTVALGTDGGTVLAPNGEQVPVPPDPETLREISRITGGTFTETADAGKLDDVYERLGSKVGTKRVKQEVSSSFAAAGLLLLLGGLGTGLRWRARL